MMSSTAWFYAGLVAAAWAAQCGLGVYVAWAKRRSRAEGFLLGFFLGIFGVMIAAFLPTKPDPREKKRRPTVEHYKWTPMDETEETVGDWLTQPRL